LLGLSRHEWGAYHLWAAYLLLALVLVHLALNFAFIKNVIAANWTWGAALLGLIGTAILAVFLLWPIGQSGEDSTGQGLRTRSGQGHQGTGKRDD
jgi:cadmium resistance protein CadD (predicted permease)